MFIVRVCLLNSCWKTCCELFQYLAALWCTVEGRKCLNWNTEYGCHLLRSVSINDLKHLDNINNTSCEAWLDELEKYYMKWVFLLFWASPLAASSTKSPHWLFSICACVRASGFSWLGQNFLMATMKRRCVQYLGPFLKGQGHA